ncbi:nicotinate-nucleotide adenylyltransferase [Clostridium paraputrificum]|uniref:Probable nicotinate-nucleotide adenylyltransferase n=1 Tax=Clostridium paraputrificum TaxID=29363 RepID=A0A1B8RPQ5_9CLOT|nr:nicotinate-nucleotide adenylyltransferase [Clostridium paraputrificum]OBY10811.1 nicotinate (nicotinamide) nucleotide adenylyltransferase [Clostridium paraputrificum]
MCRVGIIGGTFDPIHLAHIYIAEEAKKKLNLDKVIFMPAGIQPLKTDKKVTEASLRLEMVQKAIEGKIGFEVSDYEIKKEGKSYTYKTLEHFYKEYKDLYFIIGADCLLDIDKWKEIEKIFSLCKFVVFTRPGYNNNELVNKKRFVEEKYNGDIILLEVPGIHISSTEIREKIINNEKVDDILPAVVLDIIKEKGLYREH